MNPVLALALALAAGLLALRLPLPRPRPSLSLDVVLAAGAPLVVLGFLLGPGLGVLDNGTLRALGPVTALAIGWLGAGFGATLEWRVLRRTPRRAWAVAGIEAAAVLVATASAMWLLARVVPALRAVWTPKLPTLLALGSIAVVSGPSVVARVARRVGVRTSVARVFARAAVLDTALGVLIFALALAFYHPRQPFARLPAGPVGWIVALGVSSAGVGMLLVWLSRLKDPRALGLDLLGVILFGAGIGYAADLSPFVVCALAMALVVNLSPHRRQVTRVLEAWEGPVSALFLVIAGALLDLPTPWVLAAAVALALVRIAVRWGTGRVATVAQGGVALALALSFHLIYPAASVMTTVVLAVALSQAVAGPALAATRVSS